MKAMTHRERVLAALSHQQPDRVPIDLGGSRNSSIVAEGYERMKTHFGVQEKNIITNRMMQTVDVNETILRALDIDTRGIFPVGLPDVELDDRRYRDEWGVERVNPPGTYYYDEVNFPLAGEITIQDIVHYPWPDPTAAIRRQGLKERARQIHAQGCAAMLNMQSAFVHTSQYLRGFQDWYMDTAADKKLAGALFDAVLEVTLGICRTLLEEVGQEVDVLVCSDDLGLQSRLMVSPATYRELFAPRHRQYFQLMHDLSPAKVFFHSCGSVVSILDDLVDMGVEVLNPVQVAAAGMEPQQLKERYRGRLAFWGAVDTQHTLPHGSVADVEAEVEQRIEELGEGGGYVLCAVHNLQRDVPLDNILAMYRHAREYVPSFAQG